MWKKYFLVVLLINTVLVQTAECVRDNNIRRWQRIKSDIATNNIRPQSRNYYGGRGLGNNILRQSPKPRCESPPDRGPVIDDTKDKTLWQILEQSKTKFTLDPNHKDVILLLGNTGSGKTTVTQLIAGNAQQLMVVQTKDGNKIIIDPDQKIGMTTASQTLIPELVVDSATGLAFYDCPGFQDNRGADIDITINYLLEQILKHSSSVKLVFVVIYSAVSGTNDKTNFDNLATAVAKLINDVGKLNKAISLIVTKAPNFDPSDGEPLTDEAYMKTVTEFLRMYVGDQEKTKSDPKADQNFISKKIAFANSLLEANKIGVMPTPAQCGPLINNERQIQAKSKLLNLMQNNIASVQTAASDFGFPLSADSLNRIAKYKDDVNQQVTTLIKNLVGSLKQEQQNKLSGANNPSTFIDEEKSTFNRLYENIDTDSSTPESIGNAIRDVISSRGYNSNLGTNFATAMQEQNTFLQFFDEMTKTPSSSIRYRALWIQPIKSWIIDEMGERSEWYAFLATTKDIMTKFDFHRNKKKVDLSSIPSNPTVSFLDSIGVPMSPSVRDILENKSKRLSDNDFQILRAILTETLENPSIQCDGDKMTVTGCYIKVSDFMKDIDTYSCSGSTTTVRVFARRKIFIDMNVSPNHKQIQDLAIISPLYEVVTSSQALITLDGDSATQDWSGNAPNGADGGHDGTIGAAGSPGYTAGRFFGITDEISGPLRITANGGSGSSGQNGGSGTDGVKGGDTSYSNFPGCGGGASALHAYCDRVENGQARGAEYWCYKYGGWGTAGGNGKDGGKGGTGGYAGQVQVVKAENGAVMQIDSENHAGNNGNDGTGGNGGEGGLRGGWVTAMMSTAGAFLCGWQQITSGPSTERSSHGSQGTTGGNTAGQGQPQRRNFEDTKSIANEFIQYAKDKGVPSWSNDFVSQIQRSGIA